MVFAHLRFPLSAQWWALASVFILCCGPTKPTSSGSSTSAGAGASTSSLSSSTSSPSSSSSSGGFDTSTTTNSSSSVSASMSSGGLTSTESTGTSSAGPTSGGGGGTGGVQEDLFFPEGIELRHPPIELPGLALFAYTLREGQQGLELYVALRNDAQMPACGASISVDLYDGDERSLASSVIGVIGGSPYQVVELPGTYSSCVPPGRVAMAALTDWPDDVSVDAVRVMAYRCPYFDLAVTAAPEFQLSNVERESTAAGDVYRGTFTNQLEIAVETPEVVIFPKAESGRPLGMLGVQGTLTLLPGDSWAFETAAGEVSGDDFSIFPSASQASSG